MVNIDYIKLNINFNDKKKTVRIYYYLAADVYLKIFKYKNIDIFILSKEEKKVIIDYVEKLLISSKNIYFFNETINFNFLLNTVIYQDIIRHLENNHLDELYDNNILR